MTVAADTIREVDLHGLAHGGEAVGRLPDGRVVFVAGGIPGERVRVEVTALHRRWARARLLEVLDASPDRTAPPCPYYGRCGGCDLMHIAPDARRRLLRQVVREQLERLGGIDDPPVDAVRPVGGDLGYRTTARMHAAADGRLGFHAPRSTEVVPIDRCLVLAPGLQALREEVGDATGAAEVILRLGDQARVVALRPGPGPLHIPEGDFDVVLVQPDGGVVALRGTGELSVEIAGCTYRADATSFLQPSPAAAAAIVEQVVAAVGPVGGLEVWDLYAGVGLLSIPLALAGAEVTAVEADRHAAGWAQRNADAAGVDIEVVADRVERFLRRRDLRADVVVLDPPRRGAGQAVARTLAELTRHRIVYVACDVAALARDARVLTTAGWRLVRAVPLDCFPQTHHVEIVATFLR